MNLKTTWIILVLIFLANSINASREKRCAGTAVSSSQRLPAQVNAVLAAITPTESAVFAQVQQTNANVVQSLQPIYDKFNLTSELSINNMTNVSMIFNQCALDQIGATVPSSVYDPIQTCIDANINMANYVLKTMHESARTEASNFINNYNRQRAECLILTATSAKTTCLQQAAAQLEIDSRTIIANLQNYIVKGQRMISSYENSTAMCYTNNIMNVASALQNLGVDPNTCEVQLPVALLPTFDMALNRYISVANQLNEAMQKNFDIASIQLATLDHFFNCFLQTQLDNLNTTIRNIILCGKAQRINITTSIGNPILNCLQINDNNMTLESESWKSYLNNTVYEVWYSLIITRNNCVSLPVINDQINCLLNAADSFENNSTDYILRINSTLTFACDTVHSLVNNLYSCPIIYNQTVINNAENLGVDFKFCHGPYIDWLALALRRFNWSTSETNDIINGSIASSLNALEIIIENYTITFENASAIFQQFIGQIRQCGRQQGIADFSLSIFEPIANCISFSNDVVQSLIPVWRSTLLEILPTAIESLENSKNYCMSLSTTRAIKECLKNTAITYRNRVPIIIRDIQPLLMIARTMSFIFGDVINYCKANQQGFVFLDISNTGINLANCNNISTANPIINANRTSVALQIFNASITQVNGLVRNRSMTSLEQLQSVFNSHQLSYNDIQESVRLFTANIRQCALNQGISNISSTVFNPFTNCITNTNNKAVSQMTLWNATLDDIVTAAIRQTDYQRLLCLTLTSSSATIQCLNNAATSYNISQENTIRDYNSGTILSTKILAISMSIFSYCFDNNYGQVLTSISNLGVNVSQCTNIPINTLPVLIDPFSIPIQNFLTSISYSNSFVQAGFNTALSLIDYFITTYNCNVNNIIRNLQNSENLISQCSRFRFIDEARSIYNSISRCVSTTNNIAQNSISVWRSGFVSSTLLILETVEEEGTKCFQQFSLDEIIYCLSYTSNYYRKNVPTIIDVYYTRLQKMSDELDSFETAIERCYIVGNNVERDQCYGNSPV